VGDELQKRGWHLNQLQNPASIHLCLTKLHTQEGKADQFLSDLEQIVCDIHKDIKGTPATKNTGSAGIYGMAGSLPDGPVSELLKTYLDVTLSV
jgi:sphinganine-1-phosphate aldolase